MAAVYVCSRAVSVRAPYRKWNAHGKVSGRLSRFAALRRREHLALGGQFNRDFVVGLAGATIVSLGLFALSRAGARSEVQHPRPTRYPRLFGPWNVRHVSQGGRK